MTSKIDVCSIPHSGTRLAELLFDGQHCHLHADRCDKVMREAEHVIVPLRHPQKVAESWWKRGRSLKKGGKHSFWWFWNTLQDYSEQRKLIFLPVDHPDRDRLLDAASEAAGRPYVERWKWVKVGETDNKPQNEPMPMLDLSRIWQNQIVVDFYGEYDGR